MRYELHWTAKARWNDQYGLPCAEERTTVLRRIEGTEEHAFNHFMHELARMGHHRSGRDREALRSFGKARETSVAALHIIGRGRLSLVEVEPVGAESGTIRPATLVGLLFALVPLTLLLTFSARLAGMLAGTVGGVA